MLDTFLPRKVQRSLSRTSSSSGSVDGGVSLLPLTSHVDNNSTSYHHPQTPEGCLRQRNTVVPINSQSITRDDEESNSSEDDEPSSSKGNMSPSPLNFRSVLGTSPFLLGPHNIFSTSDISSNQPSRTRKESGDGIDLENNNNIIEKKNIHTPSISNNNNNKLNLLYRRSAPQSQPSPLLMSSSVSSSSHESSSFSDVDIESSGGEQQQQSNCALADEVAPLSRAVTTTKRRQSKPPTTYQRNYAFVLRSRENVIIHFLMELRMLQIDLPFVLFTTFFQFFHSAITNVAYYQHAQLNAANRVPLQDIAFDYLPPLDGELWVVSEYIFLALLGVLVSCVASNLIVKWNAPHGKPIYCMQIIRRLLMTWCVCQTLRMISFLITTLPGASRQCRYAVPEGLTSTEMLNGPAPDEGNPAGWAPPTELADILFRVDAANGCGDLMFSSHTIYTMSFVCIIFKYFNFRCLKLIISLLQIAIIPFILAARKHYSVDVFTALYVVPMVFYILATHFPDRDTSVDMAKHYGIRFYLAEGGGGGGDTFSYVVSIWGREWYVDSEHLPFDIKKAQQKRLQLPWGRDKDDSRSLTSVV